MAALAGLVGASMAANAMTSISSAYAESQAMRMKGDFQKSIDDSNSRMAGVAGSDAIRRGETEATLNDQKVKRVIGDQRASFAAQGVDVNSGSAADVQKSAAGVGALESMTIRNNALREAMGYKVQALNYSSRGQFAELEARSDSQNTLLTGGMKAIGQSAESAYWFSKK